MSADFGEAETVLESAASRVNGRIPALQFRGYEADQVFDELNQQLSYSANIAKLASARNLADDLQDVRIREHTDEEVESAEKYFDFRLKAVELSFVKSVSSFDFVHQDISLIVCFLDYWKSEFAGRCKTHVSYRRDHNRRKRCREKCHSEVVDRVSSIL